MFQWTQENAVREINLLMSEIPFLRNDKGFSVRHTSWLARTLGFLEQVFGRNSRYYLSIANLPWMNNGTMLIGGQGDPGGIYNPQAAIERQHHRAYLSQLDVSEGLLQAALLDLERRGIAAVYDGKDTPPESSAIVKIITLLERKLRKALRERPEKERQVQDALETLLVGADIVFERETDSIIYSTKTYTPDFSFASIDLAVEIKLCSRTDREKELIAEINDDILAYKTKYGNLIFAIYDLGYIRDQDRFRESLERSEGVIVLVIKH